MSDTQKCDWLIGYSIAQNEFKNNAVFCNTKEEIMFAKTPETANARGQVAANLWLATPNFFPFL
jgi:hypothetical protein